MPTTLVFFLLGWLLFVGFFWCGSPKGIVQSTTNEVYNRPDSWYNLAMKYVITVEITNGDRPLKAKDLRGQLLAKFPRTAPKLFRKAIRLLCWPFGANIKIEFVEESHVNQPGGKKGPKRKSPARSN